MNISTIYDIKIIRNEIASKHSSTTNYILMNRELNSALFLFDTKLSQLWVTPSIGKELNLCHLLTDESI